MQHDPSENPDLSEAADSGDAAARSEQPEQPEQPEHSKQDQPQAAPHGTFRYAQPPAPPTLPAPQTDAELQRPTEPRPSEVPAPQPTTGAQPRYAPPPPDAPQPPRTKPDPEFITESTSEPTLDSVSMIKAVDAPSAEEPQAVDAPPVEEPPLAPEPPAVEAVGPKPARGGHVASPADPRSAPLVTPAMYHAPDEEQVSEDTDDATLIQARRPWLSRWTIVGNGQSFQLYTRNLLGRRPALPRGYDAQLITLTNATKTVSKTHARLEVEGSTLWVTDMGSTNGTYLSFESDDGPAYQECEPGDDYEVRVGDTITFGDVEMTVAFDEAVSGGDPVGGAGNAPADAGGPDAGGLDADADPAQA